MKHLLYCYRAVALDLRGFGESEKPQRISEYHMSKLTDDVKEFIEYLGKIHLK